MVRVGEGVSEDKMCVCVCVCVYARILSDKFYA